MKLAGLLFTIAFLSNPVVRAQDLSLVEPGDILVVKILRTDGKTVSKVEAVTEKGTLRPPHLPGITSSESVIVAGLSVDEAIDRLTRSYSQDTIVQLHSWSRFEVIVERGTVSQLLEQ
jgi:hypothetical protein